MKPDWGKPTVRNFRGEDGNGSYRAILLPERKAETPKRPSLSLRLRAPYLYPDQRRDLLVAMGPDRRHPGKGGRVPRPRFVAGDLDRMSPARQRLGKQVRSIV